MTVHADYRLSQLDQLEAESIHIFREVAAEFEKPVLMFSGGKDSIVMLRLAEKAFFPAKIPFPLLQVDTGLDFPEVLSRPATTGSSRLGVRPDRGQRRGGDQATASSSTTARPAATGCRPAPCSTPSRRTASPRPSVAGVATRRRPAPRSASTPTATTSVQWDPKNQRPELWSLYNGRLHGGEHMRIFPLSNWTELDVWHYLRPGGRRAPVDLLRPPAPGLQARRHVADARATSTPASPARRSSRRPCASAPSAT